MPLHFRLARAATAWCAALCFCATAAAEVTLTLDATPGNVGETVEIGVRLAATGGSVPTTMVLFVTYDAARVAPAAEFYATGPVQASAALTAAGKQATAEVFPEGVMSIGVLGGTGAMPAGLVLTLAFEILSGSPEGISVLIDGREQDEPVLVNGEDSFSTVSNANAQPLPLRINDGAVIIGCTPRADTPGNLTATTGRDDGVLLTWSGVADPGATYRVFRAGVNDFNLAQPLGAAITATNFLDTTAAAPELPEGAGCACPGPEPEVTTYFYWVVARTAAGCTGNPGGPAQGSRGGTKTTPAPGDAAVDALPAREAGADARLVGPTDPVAARLPVPEAGDLADLWAEIPELDRAAYRLERVARGAAGERWVRAVPTRAWPAGQVFHLRVGGRDGAGTVHGPVSHAFRVADERSSVPGARVEPVDPASLPYLEVGVNAVWRLAPETVFDAPRVFLVPVPEDEDPRAMVVYRYVDAAEAGWYPAERVRGWLASAPSLHREGGRVYVRLEAHHGGLVQLGTRMAARPEARAASLPWGDAAVVGLLALGLLAAGAGRRRAGRARR